MSDLFNLGGAEFSQCGKYRYALWRIWDTTKPLVVFIGLNPSTANATQDDPTIRRVKSFARHWGFGGVCMLNLFAIISPDPKVLTTCPDPLGENDATLYRFAKDHPQVVFAWGSFKEAKSREKAIIEMFPNAICLKKSKGGNPWHPLYVPSSVQPIYFQSEKPWNP